LYFWLMKVQYRILSWGGRRLFCCARHFRTANSKPLISISRNPPPFGKLRWKAMTKKCDFRSSAPVRLLAPARTAVADKKYLSRQVVKTDFLVMCSRFERWIFPP
jgi:hypothetical protein